MFKAFVLICLVIIAVGVMVYFLSRIVCPHCKSPHVAPRSGDARRGFGSMFECFKCQKSFHVLPLIPHNPSDKDK